MNCLFCKIVNGEIPSYTIYEDDIAKVFLDIKGLYDRKEYMVEDYIYWRL